MVKASLSAPSVPYNLVVIVAIAPPALAGRRQHLTNLVLAAAEGCFSVNKA
jgi:hypothetical protein